MFQLHMILGQGSVSRKIKAFLNPHFFIPLSASKTAILSARVAFTLPSNVYSSQMLRFSKNIKLPTEPDPSITILDASVNMRENPGHFPSRIESKTTLIIVIRMLGIL